MSSLCNSLASLCNAVVKSMVQRHYYTQAMRVFQEIFNVIKAGLLSQPINDEASLGIYINDDINRSCLGIYEMIHQFYGNTLNDSTVVIDPATMCHRPFDVQVVLHDEDPTYIERKLQKQKENSTNKELINILLIEINNHCNVNMKDDDNTCSTSFSNSELLCSILLQNYASTLFCLALRTAENESRKRNVCMKKAYTMYKMSIYILYDILRPAYSQQESDESNNNNRGERAISSSTMIALAAMNTAVVLRNLMQFTALDHLEFFTEEERKRQQNELDNILSLIKSLREANLLPTDNGKGMKLAPAA